MATKAEVEILLKRKERLVKGLEEILAAFKKVEGSISTLAGKKVDLDITLFEAKLKRLKDIKIELDTKSVEKAEKDIKRLADGATRDVKKLSTDIANAKPFEALPKDLEKQQAKLDRQFKTLVSRFDAAIKKLKVERDVFGPLSKQAKAAQVNVERTAQAILNFTDKVPAGLKRVGASFGEVTKAAATARQELGKIRESRKALEDAEKATAKLAAVSKKAGEARAKAAKAAAAAETKAAKQAEAAAKKIEAAAKRTAKEAGAAFKRLSDSFNSAVRKLKVERDLFGPLSKQAKAAEKSVARTAQAIVNFGQKASPALKRASAGFAETTKRAKRARQEVGRLAKTSFERFTSSINTARAAVTAFFASIVIRKVVDLGKSAADAAIDLIRLTNILETTPGIGGKAADVIQRLAEQAEKFGVSLEPLQKNFALFAATAARAGLTLEETNSIYDSVIVASSALGLASEDVDSVIRQLTQGLAKNKLEWQDIRIIMERIPGISELIRKGLKLNKEDFEDLRKKGLIPAKEAFIALGPAIDEAFGAGAAKNAESIVGSIGRMQTAVLELRRSVGNQLIPEIEEWLNLLTRGSKEQKSFFQSLGDDVAALSRQLRVFVENAKLALGGNFTAIFADIKAQLADFVLSFGSAFLKIAEGAAKIFGGPFRKAMSESVARSRQEFEDWKAGVIQGFEEQAKAARQSAREQADAHGDSIDERAAKDAESAKRREELAAKARADFAAGLKKDEEEESASQKRRLSATAKFFQDRAGLDTGGGPQDIAVGTSGAGQAASEIAQLTARIEELDAQLVRTNQELNELDAAKDRLFELTSGFQAAAAAAPAFGAAGSQAVRQVGDATAAASELVRSLLDDFQAGAFDEFGVTAVNALSLISTELGRLVEGGRVTDSQLQGIMSSIGGLFRDAGIPVGELGTTAAQAAAQIGELAAKHQQAAQEAQAHAQAAEEVGAAVRVIEGDAVGGGDAITNLSGAERRAAEEAANLARETLAAGKGIISISGGAEKAAKATGDLAAEAPGAAAGLDQVAASAAAAGPALEAVAAPVQKVAASVKEVATSAEEAATALPAVETQISAIATAAETAVSGGQLAAFFEELSKPVPDLEKLVPLLESTQEALEKILEDAEKSDDLEKMVRFFTDLTAEQIITGTETLATNLTKISTNLKLVGTDAEGARTKLNQFRQGIKRLLEQLKTFLSFAQNELPEAVFVIVKEFAKINDAIERQLEQLELLRQSFEKTLIAHGVMVQAILEGNQSLIDSYADVVNAREGTLGDT